MSAMTVEPVRLVSDRAGQLAEYAQSCSWRVGPHFAQHIRENTFGKDDTVFVLLEDGWKIAGYCALCAEDFIPDCPYTPWCSWVFVDDDYRGKGYVGLLIEACRLEARKRGCETLYVCSDHEGLYEKYGFTKLETRLSRAGTPQSVFARGTRF